MAGNFSRAPQLLLVLRCSSICKMKLDSVEKKNEEKTSQFAGVIGCLYLYKQRTKPLAVKSTTELIAVKRQILVAVNRQSFLS